MLTIFGKAIRKIRLERDVSLLDMAEKMGLSCAYVSAVETGRKALRDEYVEKVIQSIELNESQEKELREAALITSKSNPIANIAKKENQQLVAAFARRVDELPQDTLQQIKEILDGK